MSQRWKKSNTGRLVNNEEEEEEEERDQERRRQRRRELSSSASASTATTTASIITAANTTTTNNNNTTMGYAREAAAVVVATESPAGSLMSSRSDWTGLTTKEDEERKRSASSSSSSSSARMLLRLSYHQQVVLLSTITVLSNLVFWVFYLPWQSLVALVVGTSSTCLLCLVTYRHVLTEQWSVLVETTGLGRYLLPDAVYQQLTETTLDDWMRDTTFFTEYQHLLLYFVPNMTPEQLDRYIDRLPPRHRYTLLRPGLGHLIFGQDTMRLLMGQTQYNQMLQNTYQHEQEELQQQQQQQQRQGITATQEARMIVPPPPTLCLEAEPVDASDLESNDDNDDEMMPPTTPAQGTTAMAASATTEDTTTMDRALVLNPRDVLHLIPMPTTTEGLERELDGEDALLSDAIAVMVRSYVRSLVQSIPIPRLDTYAWGLATVSVSSLGLYRYFAVAPWALAASSRRPSNTLLLTTAAVGGLGAGTMWMLKRMVVYWNDALNDDDDDKENNADPNKKQQ